MINLNSGGNFPSIKNVGGLGGAILGALQGASTSVYNTVFGIGKSAIDFHFQGDLGNIMIPVNPSELTIPKKYANKTAEIVGLGEVNVLGDPKLSTLSINSWFPYKGVMSFLNGQGVSYAPEYFVSFFSDAAKNKSILKMVVTYLDISMLVSIEEFERKNQGGEYDDIYYKLKLKEYKEFGAIKLDFETDENGDVVKDVNTGAWKVKNTSLTTSTGETLIGDKKIPSSVINQSQGNVAAIARKYTGDDKNWKSMLASNQETMGDGLGNYFGTTLKIPEILRK
ncbi:hypothetical protein [Anaerosinus massiliensis]|uniref:hypothetical protein n=1 Tax=Massilibacillus massiliensis TaxID=1806837 RepID=UPI000DA60905|nr:hypothetical protein [Massilibacillus massiliensis]